MLAKRNKDKNTRLVELVKRQILPKLFSTHMIKVWLPSASWFANDITNFLAVLRIKFLF